MTGPFPQIDSLEIEGNGPMRKKTYHISLTPILRK